MHQRLPPSPIHDLFIVLPSRANDCRSLARVELLHGRAEVREVSQTAAALSPNLPRVSVGAEDWERRTMFRSARSPHTLTAIPADCHMCCTLARVEVVLARVVVIVHTHPHQHQVASPR